MVHISVAAKEVVYLNDLRVARGLTMYRNDKSIVIVDKTISPQVLFIFYRTLKRRLLYNALK